MPKKRILYLTHRVPYPPDRGDRIRSYHTLCYLAERAEIHLGCLSDDPVLPEQERRLEELCEEVCIVTNRGMTRLVRGGLSLLKGKSITSGMFASGPLWNQLREWGRKFDYDALLVFCSNMASYMDVPELKSVPKVVDLVDVDSEKWFEYTETASGPKKYLYRTEGKRVRKLEEQVAQRARAVTLVSAAEAELFRETCPNANAQAIVNGVDTNYFHPTAEVNQDTVPHCVFVGVLDYRANVDGLQWFCEHVWPGVRAEFPTAQFTIVGRNPGPAAEKLGQLPGVTVAGEVPDVRTHMRQANVVIAPLRVARGIQNKVLEALSMGQAVIGSEQALTGITLQRGQDAICATTADQWIAEIARLGRDSVVRKQLGEAGRNFVLERHSWSACLQPFGEILEL